MTWSGGNCPKCGEFMPLGVFRCRYCHAALDGSEGGGEIDAAPVAVQADGDDVVSTPAVATPAAAAEMASPPSPVAVKETGQKAKRRDDGTRREADPSNSPLMPTHSPEHRSGGGTSGRGGGNKNPSP